MRVKSHLVIEKKQNQKYIFMKLNLYNLKLIMKTDLNRISYHGFFLFVKHLVIKKELFFG